MSSRASAITTIKPTMGLVAIDWQEIWRYRELLVSLVYKNILVRYKQTVIGGLWAILKPLTTMIVFSFFFGKIAKIPSEGIPYPIFSYAGLLLWSYFSSAVAEASSSVVAQGGIISKVYFPRLIIPISATITGLVDYLIASVIMLGLMLYYNFVPDISILFLPLVLVMTWMLAFGVGLWLSAANAIYRDFQFLTGFLMSLWIYATPVIYPLSVAGRFKWIVLANPMSGLIEAHRAMWLGTGNIDGVAILISVVLTLLITISGLVFFKYFERTFIDVM